MNDKQRAEFEKWAEGSYVLDKSKYGEYLAVKTNLAWKAWQAAIASVVVKLPPRLRGIDEQCRINNKAVDMMQQKLTEAGIRYE